MPGCVGLEGVATAGGQLPRLHPPDQLVCRPQHTGLHVRAPSATGHSGLPPAAPCTPPPALCALCGSRAAPCACGPRTSLAALMAASVRVRRLGQANWLGSDHAPRGRMPSITMCMPGAVERMYASSARILPAPPAPRSRRAPL